MKYILSHDDVPDMLKKASPGPWIRVPFFFHDRGLSVLQKTVEGLLQELLFCLLRENEDLLNLVVMIRVRRFLNNSSSFFAGTQARNVISSHEKQQATLRSFIANESFKNSIFTSEQWTMEELNEAISALIEQDKTPLNVLFMFDALDEHQGNHTALIDILQRFGTQKRDNVNIKLCLASRQEPVFRKAFSKYPGVVIHEHTENDVRRYTHERIQTSIDDQCDEEDISQLHRLTAEITERANGVFIWVRIVVNELISRVIDGDTYSQLQKVLHDLPGELDQLYRSVLSRRKLSRENAMESYVMFQLLLKSRESFTLHPLNVATDIVLYGKCEVMSKRAMQNRVMSRCGGLIEVTAPDFIPKLLHQTVKTFLESKENSTLMFEDQTEVPTEDGSSYMLRFCVEIATKMHMNDIMSYVTHLQHLFTYAGEVERSSTQDTVETLDSLLLETGLTPASSLNTEEGSVRMAPAIDGLKVLEMLGVLSCPLIISQFASRPYDLLLQAVSNGLLRYARQKTAAGIPSRPLQQWPLLHGAVHYMFSEEWATELDAAAQTPRILKLLCERGADPNVTFQGTTPLAHLVTNRRSLIFDGRLSPRHWPIVLDCVRVLLEFGSQPNQRWRSSERGILRTMLSDLMRFIWSFDPNTVEMLRILLQYGADPRIKDSDGFTPLFFAVERENWEATRLLLEYNADPTDLGNGINALKPSKSRPAIHDQIRQMQELLQKYA